MLIVLKKTYTIMVTVQEGNDEFWEKLRDRTGCDEVTAEIKTVLAEHGFAEPGCYVRLVKFGEEPPMR